MATQNNSIAGSGYGNVYLDSLMWGCGWSDISSTSPITYFFGVGDVPADSSSIGAFTGYSWFSSEKAAFQQALNNYASVCNLQFAEAASATVADITWWLAPSSAMPGVLGLHEVPNESYSNIKGYFNADDASWSYLDKGGYGYSTIIHELGHAMGLAHPADGGGEVDATLFPGVTGTYSLGDGEMNQAIWTTMSYNDGWVGHYSDTYEYGWQGALMAFDIAALQKLYGINARTATGNDVYKLPTANATGTGWSCIWDAAGIDTISNDGGSNDCTIDLREASLTGANAGGYVSYNAGIMGGFTIAKGAVIEKAIGGYGDDVLIGNQANNTLLGGFGVDELYGGAGDDFLDGGSFWDKMSGGTGNDTYIVDTDWATMEVVTELSNEGIDRVITSVNYALTENVENLTLSGINSINGTGNELNNQIYANVGDNKIDGKGGVDTLYYSQSTSAVTVNLALTTAQSTGGSGSDTLLNIESLYGSSYNDILKGSLVSNQLFGQNGDDLLYAGAGVANDKFDGGVGNDGLSYAQTTSAVSVNLNLTSAQNTVGSGSDIIVNIENLYGTSYDDTIRDEHDTSNTIYGMTGYDFIYAGAGTSVSDKYDGGVAYDTLSFYYATTGVNANLDLNSAQNTGGCGTDAILNFENLHGSTFNDVLKGTSLTNNFNGLAGDDVLNGYLGNDVLTGGAGKDIFVFNTAPSSSTNKDTITDFVSIDDTLKLENNIFTQLSTTGVLNINNFCANATGKALDSNDFISYNTTTGVLNYDADGNGSGTAIAFAILGAIDHPIITYADFVVM